MPKCVTGLRAGDHGRQSGIMTTSQRPQGYPWTCASHFQQLAYFRDVRSAPVNLLPREVFSPSINEGTPLERRAKRQRINKVVKDYFNGVPPRILSARMTPSAIANALRSRGRFDADVLALTGPLPAIQPKCLWEEGEESDWDVIRVASGNDGEPSEHQSHRTFVTAYDSSILPDHHQSDDVAEIRNTTLQGSSPPASRSIFPRSFDRGESRAIDNQDSSPCERQQSRRNGMFSRHAIESRNSLAQVATSNIGAEDGGLRVPPTLAHPNDTTQTAHLQSLVSMEGKQASTSQKTRHTTVSALQESQTPFKFRRKKSAPRKGAARKATDNRDHEMEILAETMGATAPVVSRDESRSSPETSAGVLPQQDRRYPRSVISSQQGAETRSSVCPEELIGSWAGTQAMLEEARLNFFTQRIDNDRSLTHSKHHDECSSSPNSPDASDGELINQHILPAQDNGNHQIQSQDLWSPWSIAKKGSTITLSTLPRQLNTKDRSSFTGTKGSRTKRHSRLRSSVVAATGAGSPSPSQLTFPLRKQQSQQDRSAVKDGMGAVPDCASLLHDQSNPEVIVDEISNYVFQNSLSA